MKLLVIFREKIAYYCNYHWWCRRTEKKREFYSKIFTYACYLVNSIYSVKYYTRAVLCASIWTNFMADKYSMIIKYNMNALPSSTNAGEIQISFFFFFFWKNNSHITYWKGSGNDSVGDWYFSIWNILNSFLKFFCSWKVGVKAKLKIWRDLMSRLLLLSTISHRSNFNVQSEIPNNFFFCLNWNLCFSIYVYTIAVMHSNYE